MTDRKPNAPSPDPAAGGTSPPHIDLNEVLVVDPRVLHADSDPQQEWIRDLTRLLTSMTAEDWAAWAEWSEPIAA